MCKWQIAMWSLKLLIVICTFVCGNSAVLDIESIPVCQIPDIIISVGYEAEAHKVVTPDGYVLEMHRIPFKRNSSEGQSDRPVVFLMHGLTASSQHYINLGSDYAIAYNLADAGFDVWMGNARGTTCSRYHVELNADQDPHFFDFSWEEIAMIDLPTMINYVLVTTSQQKLHYIGHSQGGTSFLVLNSMLPEYNDKIASAHLLAGVGYQEYFPEPYLRSLAVATDSIYSLAVLRGMVEIKPFTINSNKGLVDSEESADLNTLTDFEEAVGVAQFLKYYPREETEEIAKTGGAALKQFAHYGQNIRDKKFRRWNYGSIRNRIIYGSPDPPLYDIGLITVNTTMHYTINDALLDERDVLAMAEAMPNVRVRKVARDSFKHADFVETNDVKELVTDYIISAILDVHSS